MSNRTIFLHIGMTKTGTTAIQYFISQNRARLLEDGILYRQMPWSYKNADIRRNGLFLKKTDINREKNRNKEVIVKRHDEAYATMKKWLDEADSIVLSDESLWNYFWMYGCALLQEIRDFAEDNGAEVKVIVYLRKQDSWLNSIYQQRVKKNEELNDFEQFLNSSFVKKRCLEYDKGLAAIESIVGFENLIVRKFEPKSFEQGCIEFNFLDALGIKNYEGYLVSEKQYNPSPVMNHIEIKRILNGITPSCDEDMDFDVELFWREIFKELSYKTGQTRAENVIPAEVAASIMENCRESNQRVAERYFGSATELFSDKAGSGRAAWTKDNENRYEDTIRYLGYVILKQQNEIVGTQKKLDQLEKEIKAEVKVLNKALNNKSFFERVIRKIAGK